LKYLRKLLINFNLKFLLFNFKSKFKLNIVFYLVNSFEFTNKYSDVNKRTNIVFYLLNSFEFNK